MNLPECVVCKDLGCEFCPAVPKSNFVIVTSDGEVHERDTLIGAVECLDLFGPEVVEHNVPDVLL